MLVTLSILRDTKSLQGTSITSPCCSRWHPFSYDILIIFVKVIPARWLVWSDGSVTRKPTAAPNLPTEPSPSK